MTDLTPTEVSEIRKSLDSAIENVNNVIDLLQKSEMEIISLRERAERAERERDEFAKEFAAFVVGMEETATTEIPFSERVESHLEKFKYS